MPDRDATAAPDNDDYLERIERHFGLRRGGRLMLSPRDWELVQTWRERGVPLTVVLRGINRAFDHFEASGPRPDRINSLSYCEQHVLETWEEHRELAAADGPSSRAGTRSGEAGAHLRSAAERCRGAAGRRRGSPAGAALIRAAEALEELAASVERGDLDTRDIDARAERIETALRERVPEAFVAEDDRTLPELPRFSPWAV